jgi:hypothetical protein
MKHSINLAFTASLALLTTSTFAEEGSRPNYKFAELDYVYAVANVDSDDLSTKQNNDDYYVPEGLKLQGSWVFEDEWLVRGSYYTGSGEWKSTNDVDTSSMLISAGWLPQTEDTTGIDLSLDYRSDSYELDRSKNNFDEDISGPGLSVGVRTAPFDNVEFGVRLGWYQGDYEGAIGFTLNAAYNFADNWGVNLFWDRMKADSMDEPLSGYELNQYGVGGRYYF